MDKKYCTNCGSENNVDAEYCINCGNSLVTKTVVPTEVPKKKKKKGGLVALIVILLIAGLIVGGIFLYKKLTYFEDPFGDIDDLGKTTEVTEIKTFTSVLSDDLESGKINADQYIMQLAYSLYEPDKSVYDLTYSDMVDSYYLYEEAEKYADSLSKETLTYLAKKIYLSDYEWDVEDDSSSASASASVYDAKPQYMSDKVKGNIRKLDGVVLSSDKHFLIYYSTKGDYPTTKSQAKKVGKLLESIVDTYKKEYNLDFKYSIQYNNPDDALTIPQSYNKVERLLKKNGIDPKYMETAMPVYLIDDNLEKNNHAGFYQPTLVNLERVKLAMSTVFGTSSDIEFNVKQTTYAFPFFVLDSSIIGTDNQNLVAAHELFHHYQHYICGDGSYGNCISGNFTTETTASEVAAKVFKSKETGTMLNGHSVVFTNSLDKGFMNILNGKTAGDAGYAYYVFAYNFEEVVPNGANIMFQSMKTTQPLKYISDNSNGKYKDAILKTSERTLTLDYNNKAILPYEDGKAVYPKSKWFKMENNPIYFENSISINSSSMHYQYIKPYLYSENSQLQVSSILSDVSLQFFIKEKNGYKMVYSQTLNNEFVVSLGKDWKDYDEIAIAIVDTAATGSDHYTVNLVENGDKEVTITPESLKLKTPKKTKKITSDVMCYQIEDDTEFKTVTQVKISFDENNEVNDMYARGSIVMKNYDPNDPTYKFAKGVVSGLVFVLKKQYKQQFGNVSFRTKDSGQVYSITAHVKSDYMTAIKNSLEKDVSTREEIIEGFRAEGFICE